MLENNSICLGTCLECGAIFIKEDSDQKYCNLCKDWIKKDKNE